MADINQSAQAVIDRLKAINYDEPHFNREKVVAAFKKQYKLLGTPMPQIEVADNMIIWFQLAADAARDAAWDVARGAARDAAWGAARDAAWDVAWGAASRNTGLTDEKILTWIEVSEQELIALENGLGYFFPMKDKLILVPVPRMIMVGETLHYDHGKAVEWSDGQGFYFIRGVKFEEDLYWKVVNQTIKPEETLTIKNAEQRMAAISMLKPEYLLDQMKAKLINTGQKGTRLYEVKNFMGTSRTEYCMLMDCPSTTRQYIEWTPPKIGKQRDAELCQANAFGVSLEDWLLTKQEA